VIERSSLLAFTGECSLNTYTTFIHSSKVFSYSAGPMSPLNLSLSSAFISSYVPSSIRPSSEFFFFPCDFYQPCFSKTIDKRPMCFGCISRVHTVVKTSTMKQISYATMMTVPILTGYPYAHGTTNLKCTQLQQFQTKLTSDSYNTAYND